MEITLEGEPVLRQVAREVPKVSKRVIKLAHDMEQTMYEANGVGLAAPQVGVSLRVIVVDIGDGPLHLVNPRLVAKEGQAIDKEGCLSVPGVWGYVERNEQVVVEALDLRGRPVQIEADGLLARALQHEIDHLDGVLFIDKMIPIPADETGEEDE